MHKRYLLNAVITGLVAVAAIAPVQAADAEWQVGLAAVKITPPKPVVLLGYSNRNGPFESVTADLWAKAMAFEDSDGHRGVIITTDLVGVQAVVTEPVCARITQKTGLTRGQIILNASHTHTGPLVSLKPRLSGNIGHPALSVEDGERTVAYTRALQDKLVGVVVEAVSGLAPACLSWGRGAVGFPMNRRFPKQGYIVMRANPDGPTDRTVPVLRVDTHEGELRAVLFGCACHNTTLTDAHNLIGGDYAGFAQAFIEERYPSVQAMFMSGCGADANPHPRGKMEQAKTHGANLGREVCRVLEDELEVVRGSLATEYARVNLPLEPMDRAAIETVAKKPSTEALMAKHMLTVLDRGEKLPEHYEAPFGVWQFGRELTLVALPAEPVADYVAILAEHLGPRTLWVAGYNNDCFGYLPTAGIVNEGGHENIGITLWIWGEHLSRNAGFFTAQVQDVVIATVAQLASKAGRKRATSSQWTAPIARTLDRNCGFAIKGVAGNSSGTVRRRAGFLAEAGRRVLHHEFHLGPGGRRGVSVRRIDASARTGRIPAHRNRGDCDRIRSAGLLFPPHRGHRITGSGHRHDRLRLQAARPSRPRTDRGRGRERQPNQPHDELPHAHRRRHVLTAADYPAPPGNPASTARATRSTLPPMIFRMSSSE